MVQIDPEDKSKGGASGVCKAILSVCRCVGAKMGGRGAGWSRAKSVVRRGSGARTEVEQKAERESRRRAERYLPRSARSIQLQQLLR